MSNDLRDAITAMDALPDIDSEDSKRLQEFVRVTTREVKAVGGASAGTTLEMIGYIRELERANRVGVDEYVAWCRYMYNESGGIQSIETCNSDAQGAFKVYRQPVTTPTAARAAEEIWNDLRGRQGFDCYLDDAVIDEIKTQWIAMLSKHFPTAAIEAGGDFEPPVTTDTGACLLCEKGFPIKDGVHYGTQALGMIPSRWCAALRNQGEGEEK